MCRRHERSIGFLTCFVFVMLLAVQTGFLLAVVPFLPAASHWEFYGQSSICMPMPIARASIPGHEYSLGIVLGTKLVLSVLVATGLSVSYTSLRTQPVSQTSHVNTVAHRLFAVLLSNVACWLPTGLLATAGAAIPGEVNAALAIFVLPLNSALNPALYVFNMHMEKRRRALEEKLMKVLEAKVMARRPHAGRQGAAGHGRLDSLTVEDAVHFLSKHMACERAMVETLETAVIRVHN